MDMAPVAAGPSRSEGIAPGAKAAIEKPAGRAWWLPSLTEVVFVAVLLWLLVGGNGAQALLADGDTGWHIRTGEYILAERRFPTTDLYSFSRLGAEWFAWEWGSDVVFALAHRLAGLPGVVLLGGMAIAATSAALFRFLLWQGVNVLVAVVGTLVAAAASTMHWLARPHLFTSLAFLVSLWLLEADRRQPTPWVWGLAALATLWANLHGGFVILPAVLLCYCLESGIEARRSKGNRDWQEVRRRGLFLLVATASTFVNPYTYRLHLHIWRYLRSDFIRNRVPEFAAPSFRGESMLAFELLLLAGLLVVPWLWKRREYFPALLIIGLAYAALDSARHVPLYVIAATPAVAGAASKALGSLQGGIGGAIASLAADYAPRIEGGGGTWIPLWAAGAVVLSAALLCSGGQRWRADFPREKFPQAALAAAEMKLVGHRVFTSDQWGDYLIYRFYPRTRVFIDGRSDFYGPEIGQQYLDAVVASHRWEEIFNHHGFEAALLPAEWPLATVLKAHPGWRLEYDDGQALVLRRVGSRSPISAKQANP
ncbi:MAG: hypothetical protein HY236_09355 [Acidobacteria bacterium]|nr:hypothetical protein [Acidobacteriota bacterium]